MIADKPFRTLRALVVGLRPNQWTKNAIVLAALLFGYWDPGQQVELGPGMLRALIAAALFCVASSGVYLINDIADREADRHHPLKRYRPIAAGQLPVRTAWAAALILLPAAMLAASVLAPAYAMVVAAYIGIQLVYSLGLKHVALLDVFVISAGFVLRAVGGAVALEIEISPWLLLCAFFLALFLALCKRRHEKVNLSELGGKQRASLDHYDARLLDQLIAIISSSTVVCYAIYTLSPDTASKFGSKPLGLTIPFVLFGIFRYLDLVYRHDKGDRPEKILLTDLPILVNMALYGIAVILIFVLA